MATTAELEEHSAATSAVVTVAISQLAVYMATAPELDALTEFYTELVRATGRGTASLAADFYDDLRARSRARRGFRATVAEPIPTEQAHRIVAWATAPRTFPVLDARVLDARDTLTASRAAGVDVPRADVTPSPIRIPAAESPDTPAPTPSNIEVDVPEPEDDHEEFDVPEEEDDESSALEVRDPTFEEIHERLSRSTQRLIMQPARDTIVESVDKDPADARWARVPMGEKTCAFCLVMASRGAAYTSEAAASQVVGRRGRPRGARALGESYHDECDCQAVPIWDDEDYPEHYDPEALYDMYSDARDAVRVPDLRSILAKLREEHGLR